ncbi:MAG: copper amine oxidase N-terminal domain-containing protein [Defluviitaleaceae bacterium]|nr:copper amine oxidase N-terminal domain-containing protein [Defluviitaleaceae bacterium]
MRGTDVLPTPPIPRGHLEVHHADGHTDGHADNRSSNMNPNPNPVSLRVRERQLRLTTTQTQPEIVSPPASASSARPAIPPASQPANGAEMTLRVVMDWNAPVAAHHRTVSLHNLSTRMATQVANLTTMSNVTALNAANTGVVAGTAQFGNGLFEFVPTEFAAVPPYNAVNWLRMAGGATAAAEIPVENSREFTLRPRDLATRLAPGLHTEILTIRHYVPVGANSYESHYVTLRLELYIIAPVLVLPATGTTYNFNTYVGEIFRTNAALHVTGTPVTFMPATPAAAHHRTFFRIHNPGAGAIPLAHITPTLTRTPASPDPAAHTWFNYAWFASTVNGAAPTGDALTVTDATAVIPAGGYVWVRLDARAPATAVMPVDIGRHFATLRLQWNLPAFATMPAGRDLDVTYNLVHLVNPVNYTLTAPAFDSVVPPYPPYPHLTPVPTTSHIVMGRDEIHTSAPHRRRVTITNNSTREYMVVGTGAGQVNISFPDGSELEWIRATANWASVLDPANPAHAAAINDWNTIPPLGVRHFYVQATLAASRTVAPDPVTFTRDLSVSYVRYSNTTPVAPATAPPVVEPSNVHLPPVLPLPAAPTNVPHTRITQFQLTINPPVFNLANQIHDTTTPFNVLNNITTHIHYVIYEGENPANRPLRLTINNTGTAPINLDALDITHPGFVTMLPPASSGAVAPSHLFGHWVVSPAPAPALQTQHPHTPAGAWVWGGGSAYIYLRLEHVPVIPATATPSALGVYPMPASQLTITYRASHPPYDAAIPPASEIVITRPITVDVHRRIVQVSAPVQHGAPEPFPELGIPRPAGIPPQPANSEGVRLRVAMPWNANRMLAPYQRTTTLYNRSTRMALPLHTTNPTPNPMGTGVSELRFEHRIGYAAGYDLGEPIVWGAWQTIPGIAGAATNAFNNTGWFEIINWPAVSAAIAAGESVTVQMRPRAEAAITDQVEQELAETLRIWHYVEGQPSHYVDIEFELFVRAPTISLVFDSPEDSFAQFNTYVNEPFNNVDHAQQRIRINNETTGAIPITPPHYASHMSYSYITVELLGLGDCDCTPPCDCHTRSPHEWFSFRWYDANMNPVPATGANAVIPPNGHVYLVVDARRPIGPTRTYADGVPVGNVATVAEIGTHRARLQITNRLAPDAVGQGKDVQLQNVVRPADFNVSFVTPPTPLPPTPSDPDDPYATLPSIPTAWNWDLTIDWGEDISVHNRRRVYITNTSTRRNLYMSEIIPLPGSLIYTCDFGYRFYPVWTAANEVIPPGEYRFFYIEPFSGPVHTGVARDATRPDGVSQDQAFNIRYYTTLRLNRPHSNRNGRDYDNIDLALTVRPPRMQVALGDERIDTMYWREACDGTHYMDITIGNVGAGFVQMNSLSLELAGRLLPDGTDIMNFMYIHHVEFYGRGMPEAPSTPADHGVREGRYIDGTALTFGNGGLTLRSTPNRHIVDIDAPNDPIFWHNPIPAPCICTPTVAGCPICVDRPREHWNYMTVRIRATSSSALHIGVHQVAILLIVPGMEYVDWDDPDTWHGLDPNHPDVFEAIHGAPFEITVLPPALNVSAVPTATATFTPPSAAPPNELYLAPTATHTVPVIEFTAGEDPVYPFIPMFAGAQSVVREFVLQNVGAGPLRLGAFDPDTLTFEDLQFTFTDLLGNATSPSAFKIIGIRGMDGGAPPMYLQEATPARGTAYQVGVGYIRNPGEHIIITIAPTTYLNRVDGLHQEILQIHHGPIDEGFTGMAEVLLQRYIHRPQFELIPMIEQDFIMYYRESVDLTHTHLYAIRNIGGPLLLTEGSIDLLADSLSATFVNGSAVAQSSFEVLSIGVPTAQGAIPLDPTGMFLMPGHIIPVVIALTPQATELVGTHTAVLTFTHGEGLTGFGYSASTPIAELEVLPPGFAFTNVNHAGYPVLPPPAQPLDLGTITMTVGDNPANHTRRFALVNTGNGPMYIGYSWLSYLFADINPDFFTVSWNVEYPYVLMPGEYLIITLTPTAAAVAQAGQHNGQLIFTHGLGSMGYVVFALVVNPRPLAEEEDEEEENGLPGGGGWIWHPLPPRPAPPWYSYDAWRDNPNVTWNFPEWWGTDEPPWWGVGDVPPPPPWWWGTDYPPPWWGGEDAPWWENDAMPPWGDDDTPWWGDSESSWWSDNREGAWWGVGDVPPWIYAWYRETGELPWWIREPWRVTADDPLWMREPWRPMPLHPFDRRYQDIEFIIIPDHSDRIHRVERYIAQTGVIYQNVVQVIQDVYSWRRNDTTWVSMRFISEALRIDVEWDAELQLAYIDRGGRNIIIRPGATYIWAGGHILPVRDNHGILTSVPMFDGRIFLPLETIGMIMGLPVRRNDYTQTSYLYMIDWLDFFHFRYAEFDIDIVRVPVGGLDVYNLTRRVENGYVSYDENFHVDGDATAWFVDESNTAMVPLRWVADALGYELNWCDETQTATMDTRNRTIHFIHNQNYMYVNGERVAVLDELAQYVSITIIEGRMFVPMRALGDALEMPVAWNPYTQMAYLYLVR